MRVSAKSVLAGGAVTLVVAVFPLAARRDSYPLSDLPMFATTRERISRFTTAVGVTERGDTVRLDPETIAHTDEVIAAQAALVNAVNSGESQDLCSEIARRARDLTLIRIQTETHDILASLEEPRPLRVRVHAECRVP